MILHQTKNSFLKNIDLNIKIGKTFKTNSHRYLEIIIDRNSKWSKHKDTINKYYKKTFGVLKKNKTLLK